MKVKIISSFGENVFEIPEEKVWAVLQEAAKQAKTNTSENSDQPSASQEHPVSQKEELEPESEKSRKTLECYLRSSGKTGLTICSVLHGGKRYRMLKLKPLNRVVQSKKKSTAASCLSNVINVERSKLSVPKER